MTALRRLSTAALAATALLAAGPAIGAAHAAERPAPRDQREARHGHQHEPLTTIAAVRTTREPAGVLVSAV